MDPLRVGYAEREITPRVPVSLAGYFNRRMWTGVVSDIKVRTVCFQSGGRECFVMIYDLVKVGRRVWEAVNREMTGDGVDARCLVQAATHTHTAPCVEDYGDGWTSAEYEAFLVSGAVESAGAARLAARPVTSAFAGVFDGPPLSFNRRYWMKDGKVVTNPGKLNPGIVRPEGPVDRSIGVLRFTFESGPDLYLLNIVNHADSTGGCLVSPDWPGVLARKLSGFLDCPADIVTIVGAAGNINHFDVASAADQTSPREAERIGDGYARAVAGNIGALAPVSPAPLFCAAGTFAVPPRRIPPGELEAYRRQARYPVQTGRDLTSEDLARRDPAALAMMARYLLENLAGGPRTLTVSAVRLGDAGLVFLPGEPFVEIGLDIKRASPAKITFISELNGAGEGASYIPNPENFDRGGYETHPRSSPLDRDLGVTLGLKSRELLERLWA